MKKSLYWIAVGLPNDSDAYRSYFFTGTRKEAENQAILDAEGHNWQVHDLVCVSDVPVKRTFNVSIEVEVETSGLTRTACRQLKKQLVWLFDHSDIDAKVKGVKEL